jgi:hypothetical protein
VGDLIVDLDVIASRLAGSSLHAWDRTWLPDALRKRNALLGSLSDRDVPHRHVWLVMTEADAERRQWWRDKLGIAETVVLATSAVVCHARIASDAERAGRADAAMAAVTDWWRRYRSAAGETVIFPEKLGSAGGAP